MNINQALKEKNKIAGKIATLKTRISSSNVRLQGNNMNYNVKELIAEYNDQVENLIVIKEKISRATQGIIHKILLMGELKGLISLLKSMDVRSGKQVSYSDVETVYLTQINEVQRDKMVEDYEERIFLLQDDIDMYNASTKI